MTTVYIIRHGQTNSNIKSTYLGKTDIPLNEDGMSQSREAAMRLKGKFDVLYSSPLLRAVSTAEAFSDRHSLRIILNSAIEERNYGIFDDMTMEEIQAKYPEEHKLWREDWFGYAPPEGESAKQVHERVGNALERIISNNKGKKILVVTHLGAARHMIASLLQMRLEDTYKFALDNARAAVITIDDENRRILMGLNV